MTLFRPLILLLCAFRLAALQPLLAQNLPESGASKFKSALRYRNRTVEGWSVHIREELFAERPETIEKAVLLLRKQLKEIIRVVPNSALPKLRKVVLWFSLEYPGVGPRAEYHPGREWLIENRRNPEMAKGIEFTNVSRFALEMDRMPNFVLHELAHSFHDQTLGFQNADVSTAFKNAKSSKNYDLVERWNGSGHPVTREPSYAMTNPQEYFAESTEAYFGRNDFFPFTREELKRVDPEMEGLLKRLWNSAQPRSSSRK